MTQSRVTRRALVQGGVSLALVGCMDQTGARRETAGAGLGIKPLDISLDRLMRVTVCTRPFRPAGPRLEIETVADKTVVHSYGHGGSGWSLAWGSAEAAAQLALAGSPASVAVVGAGAIGLTTATVLQRTGVPTTIYAKEMPAESRSARATGTWSPDSRIAMRADASPDFPQLWEALARRSFAAHQHYVGTLGHPVEFSQRYTIPSDTERRETEDPDDFLHMDRRIRDLTPRFTDLEPGSHPFPTEATPRHGPVMTFNIAEYSRRLMGDFLQMGGRIIRTTFNTPAEVAALPAPVIVNCTGYGAKTLWQDDSLVPVRGQIGWLTPQPDRLYGVVHENVIALSRRDGVLIQHFGENEYYGYGDDSETPDMAELTMAIGRIAPMFDWSPS
ncbi:MAG: FAD-dependent oxidoreductase [Alphaproteobacteria bacterium]